MSKDEAVIFDPTPYNEVVKTALKKLQSLKGSTNDE